MVSQQELYTLVNAIAGNFSDPSYMQAAAEFRIPYWDWSITPPGPDLILNVMWTPTISQRGPNGVQTIANTLFSYKFHPLDPNAMIYAPVRRPWLQTDSCFVHTCA